MKKVLCIMLTVLFVFGLFNVAFAETETVVDSVYGDDIIEFTDDVIPESVPETNSETELPQTGGIPVQLFYAVGGLFIIAAIVISRKKEHTRTDEKN